MYYLVLHLYGLKDAFKAMKISILASLTLIGTDYLCKLQYAVTLKEKTQICVHEDISLNLV